MKYTVANVKGNPNKYGKLSFDILEDGIAIAKVTRGTARAGWIPLMVFKFYTERAEVRFENFCDSLSMTETCEALLTHTA